MFYLMIIVFFSFFPQGISATKIGQPLFYFVFTVLDTKVLFFKIQGSYLCSLQGLQNIKLSKSGLERLVTLLLEAVEPTFCHLVLSLRFCLTLVVFI